MELGKTMIFGDSYSTFVDYIPEGYDCCYKKLPPFEDVDCVEKTWWWQVIENSQGSLLLNDSFSGSTVCHTGYNGRDCKDNSFVARFLQYKASGFFENNAPDTVFVFGGTNDNWAGSPLGEIKTCGFVEHDLYCVFPAFSFLIDQIKKTLPSAKIVIVLNCDLKKELEIGIKEICSKLGVCFVQLESVEKVSGHPTAVGMKQIASQILSVIDNKN